MYGVVDRKINVEGPYLGEVGGSFMVGSDWTEEICLKIHLLEYQKINNSDSFHVHCSCTQDNDILSGLLNRVIWAEMNCLITTYFC